MHRCTRHVFLPLLLLACAPAQAQVGLGEAGLAIASALLMLLAIAMLLLWGLASLCLYFIVPRLRRRPRPTFRRAALQALLAPPAAVLLLMLAGKIIQLVDVPAAEEGLVDAAASPLIPPPSETLIRTQREAAEPCRQRACARSRLTDPAGEALAGIDFCVKNPDGQVIARGRSEADGSVLYLGNEAGEQVAFELCWLSLSSE